MTEEDFVRAIQAFIRGEDVSIASSKRIEAALTDLLPDDDEAQDIALMLASYTPGGGAFLHNEREVAARLEKLLQRVL